MIVMAMIAGAGLAGAAAPSPVPGTVAIALVGGEADDADDQPFADAVGQALGTADYTILPDHSRYVAEVSVARETRGVVATRVAKPPASVGAGALRPVIAVPLGSRKTALRDLIATTLTIRLVTRAGHRPVWAGSAMTASVADAPVATKLARAAFASYPRTIATTVSVP